MSFELFIRDVLGERRFDERDFPLSLGGPGSSIVVAGLAAGPAAYLAWHDEQLFVQPAGSVGLLHNGLPVADSMWLQSGDVLNLGAARLRLMPVDGRIVLAIDDGSVGNLTAPPVIAASTRVSGAGTDEEERVAALQFRASPAAAARRLRFNPVRAALISAAIVMAAVVWFLSTSTAVIVATTPEADHIAFRGTLPAIPLGGSFLMRPGQYELRAEKAGYRPSVQAVQIGSDQNQRIALELQKLPGILRIEVPEASQVSIDGRARGSAPGDFELEPGKYSIALKSARYLDFQGEVQIEGEGKVLTLVPELAPAWAVVGVITEPAGAAVLVDGESRGTTPLKTELLAGTHAVELRMEGFKPWTSNVLAKAGEPFTIGPVRLGLPDATLVVRSDPAGASVNVAGVYRGQTPLTLELRPEVTQGIVVTKAGYEAASRELKLGPGERSTLALSLAGIYGEVAVHAQPSDAQLLVDGQPVGAANQTLKLTATEHEIEIRKAGLATYRTKVTPRPGIAQTISTTLVTPEQSKLASLPTTVRSKAGPELRLMPAGRYTMGSPRREPGRRANEAQRAVELKRPFYLATREITNAEYRQFKGEHRSGFVGSYTQDLDRQAVVNVSWSQAVAYCNWLSQQDGLPPAYENKGGTLTLITPVTTGYRLPTEAEWEWAARYVDGVALRRYPWGDALPVAPRSGNYADHSARVVVVDVLADYDDGFAATAPVGSFAANPLGLFDLGGNVAEWTHDFYGLSTGDSGVATDPVGPAEGKQHVIRGSSWKQSSVTELRLSVRDFGDGVRNDLGFRIARYAE